MELVRQKNVATYIVFPIVDADGDTVTGAANLDSEIDTWSDSAAPDGFADCTNEATEIGATGQYYLSLTQAEMNADYVIIQVKTSTAGAKTQTILINTMVGDPLLRATATSGYTLTLDSNGRVDVSLIEGTDATNQIRDSVVDDATRIDASALNTLSSHDPGEAIMGATDLGTGTGFTAIPWNAAWDAEVQSEVHDEVLLNNLDHLMKTPVSDITKLGDGGGNEVPDSTVLSLMLCKGTDTDTYNHTTDSLEAIRDKETDIETDTAEIGVAGAGLTVLATSAELAKVPKSDAAVTWNNTALASIQSECNDAIVANNLDHLCLTATVAADMTAEVADNTILSRVLASGDTSEFDPTTDSLQDIRDKLPANLEDLAVTDTTGLVSVGSLATNSITAAALNADAVDEILDEAVEGSITLRQAMRVLLSYLAGKTNGGGTATINFRNQADDANRIVMTVDADGNRSAVSLTLT